MTIAKREVRIFESNTHRVGIEKSIDDEFARKILFSYLQVSSALCLSVSYARWNSRSTLTTPTPLKYRPRSSISITEEVSVCCPRHPTPPLRSCAQHVTE